MTDAEWWKLSDYERKEHLFYRGRITREHWDNFRLEHERKQDDERFGNKLKQLQLRARLGAIFDLPAGSQSALAWKRNAGPIEVKSIDAAVKLKGSDDQSWELYCSVFGNLDRQGEIVEPGAFKNIPEFERDGMLLLNHNMTAPPIGMIDKAIQDSHGLRVQGRFHSTPVAQEVRQIVRERMASNKSVKCSMGYRVTDAEMDRVKGQVVRRLKAIDVFEASIVGIPANAEAGVILA